MTLWVLWVLRSPGFAFSQVFDSIWAPPKSLPGAVPLAEPPTAFGANFDFDAAISSTLVI